MMTLFEKCIKFAVDIPTLYLQDVFDRDTFFKLSDLECCDTYNVIACKDIKDASREYLKKCIGDAIIVGFEFDKEMRQLLDEIGVTFVNLWFAPYKLFEDEFFILNTNDESIFYKLINYKTPEEHFYYYGNYYKAFIKNRLGFRDDFLCDNSVLFVGQCMTDISVLKDGVFLNITHFKEKISNLLSQYSKIYYIDHPFCKNVAHIDKYINQTKNIEKLEQIPTYYLLSSDKIKKVVGISSSILDEAKYFEKDVEFFFESIFQFNCKFGINNFINIYNKYYNPSFWKDIFNEKVKVKDNVLDNNLFFEQQNKSRDIRNAYFGYKYIDLNLLLSSRVDENRLLLTTRADAHIQKMLYKIYKVFINVCAAFHLSKKRRKLYRKKYL